jgi:hypothetical protein
MVFHKHPQPMAQSLHLDIEEMWKKMKLQHKYNNVTWLPPNHTRYHGEEWT